MFPLRCTPQKYAWGKFGRSSLVAQLLEAGKGDTIVNDDPYAELWMGAHPKAPSRVVLPSGQEVLLSEFVRENPAYLGDACRARFGSTLPFLFKILSVRTALSIQAHPDKALAERLHASDPGNYPDANHKPELMCALTEFELLGFFRPFGEILQFVSDNTELRRVIGEDAAQMIIAAKQADESAMQRAVKAAYVSLLKCSQSVVEAQLKSLSARVYEVADNEVFSLFLRLEQQYPNDVGLFSVFFLNYMKLAPGEAIFLRSNEPHGYISGDCIECMATSDNVVRGGLTPKFKDVDVLTEMLTYCMGVPEISRGRAFGVDNRCRVYEFPIVEFQLAEFELPAASCLQLLNKPQAVISGVQTGACSIVLVADGAAVCRAACCEGGKTSTYRLKRGDIFFVSADMDLEFETGNSSATLFRCGLGVEPSS